MSLLVTPDDLSRELALPDRRSSSICVRLRTIARTILPGAVHLDLFGISSIDTDPAPLKAFFWIIEHLLASRGVSNDVAVVVYDDTSGIRAARAFWFLEFFGHPQHPRARRRLQRLDAKGCRSRSTRRSRSRPTGPARVTRAFSPAGAT